MASNTSVASSQPDQRHLRLIAASAQGNEGRMRDILSEDPPWTSSHDHYALRQALQKVAARGKLSLVRLLLDHGAEVDASRENEVSALLKAAEGGHLPVVEQLLNARADTECRNRSGQTILFAACIKGHNPIIKILLERGANVEAQDKEGRTPLLFLASEKKKGKWTIDTLRLLLDNGANLEVKDQIGRTPLLWAATNGNLSLARVLLDYHADLNAFNNRTRTALHLASESNPKESRQDMVSLLLERGADPNSVSDGGWTPLHNAAQSGNAPIVGRLLDFGANVNAELSNGMTPLHWAAYNGFEPIVRLLLAKPEINLTVKDSFDRTPMLCAAESHNPSIVALLNPARATEHLSHVAKAACEAFTAHVVDFGQFEKKQIVNKLSVYEVLYGWDQENDKPKVPTLTKNIKYKPDFRWIHLPANNIDWAETLLAKSFIEAGHRDIEGFKALEKCFDNEHRGRYTHAHFMRTFCQRIAAPRNDGSETKKDENMLASLSEEGVPPLSAASSVFSGLDPPPKKPVDGDSSNAKYDATKKKTKSEQLAERHPKKHKRGRGPPGNPPRQDSSLSMSSAKLSTPLAWETHKFAASSGKVVLFMPFLHYETDERRRKMSRAIKNARKDNSRLLDNPSRDSLLVQAYLNGIAPRLHPRRTLDQFFYHGIDTSVRDTDQVVYRYCARNDEEPKVFMVDQLWLWIIGKDLIITCFPQRWDQPKQDPLNVLDGIIEETNAKTRPPIHSVYDLAMLITSRCSGMFDRSRLHDQKFQFLDMFEHSIGVVTDNESRLFNDFNRASAKSAKWLFHHHRAGLGRDSNLFPDALLDIGEETDLLAEIKDIRDELSILSGILDNQMSALSDFGDFINEELRVGTGSDQGPGSNSRRGADVAFRAEVKKRVQEQRRSIEVRQRDIYRMDSLGLKLYESLTDLLDLKQKHSNALEARFAGDQAMIAARQGQTIMVFTIVTIIFLPMSFIAAFFAINLNDWNQVEGDPNSGLTIAHVSKYMFGIGLGISIPLIALAFAVPDLEGKVGMIKDWITGNFAKISGKRHRPRSFISRSMRAGSRGRRKRGGLSGESDYDCDEKDDDDDMRGVRPGPPKDKVDAMSWKTGQRSLYSRQRQLSPPTNRTPYYGGYGNHQRHESTKRSDRLTFDSGMGPRLRSSHDQRSIDRRPASRLSPVSGHGGSPVATRRMSLGSGNGISWARPSLERRRDRRGSDDLESGTRAG